MPAYNTLVLPGEGFPRTFTSMPTPGTGTPPPPSELRDPWKWPFPKEWWGNIAVGSGADLKNAGLTAAAITVTNTKTDPIGFSIETTFPVKTLSKIDFFINQDNTVHTGVGGATFSAQVYCDPDAFEDGKMNGIWIFRDTLGRLWEVQPLYLNQASTDPAMKSPRAAYSATRGVNVRLVPVGGQHGGPNLTAMGLTTRTWEVATLPPAATIAQRLAIDTLGHTIGVNVPPGVVYRAGADNTNGFRWPATKADTNWNVAGKNNTYTGTNPYLKLGALCSLDAGYTASRINAGTLTHPLAILFTITIEKRGYLVVDVTGFSKVMQISVEKSSQNVIEGANATFHSEMRQTWLASKVVDNNSATNVGGGGTLRAPELADLAA